jgi:hypothetical protein
VDISRKGLRGKWVLRLNKGGGSFGEQRQRREGFGNLDFSGDKDPGKSIRIPKGVVFQCSFDYPRVIIESKLD